MARPEVESGIAQPDALPFLRFHLDGVQAFEAGGILVLSPPVIVPAGNTFTLVTELGFEGGLVPLLYFIPCAVHHHWERIEDGATGMLPQAPNVPIPNAPVPANHMRVTSGPYATSVDGGGGDLQISAGAEMGTFRITTHVLPNPGDPVLRQNLQNIFAAFHDGLVIMVT